MIGKLEFHDDSNIPDVQLLLVLRVRIHVSSSSMPLSISIFGFATFVAGGFSVALNWAALPPNDFVPSLLHYAIHPKCSNWSESSLLSYTPPLPLNPQP